MKTKAKSKSKTGLKGKNSRLLLGYDLGGTKLASAVTTLEGKIIDRYVEKVDFSSGPRGFIDFLAQRGRYWQEKFPYIKALGIASCGPLDTDSGALLQPTNFPRWGTLSLARPLERKLKIPVALQNDAAAASLAEGWLGGAKKMRNWIVLTFGTGLGTGIVMDRCVFMGGSGQGPEAGHMIVTDKPYRCGCGNLGCAESVLSGTSLAKRILERKLPLKDPKELVAAARRGDEQAKLIFMEFADILARTIHNLSVMYKPDAVFIAGGLAEARDLYFEAAQEKSKMLLANRPGFMPQMKVSLLGDDSGVLGGAWVAHFMALGLKPMASR